MEIDEALEGKILWFLHRHRSLGLRASCPDDDVMIQLMKGELGEEEKKEMMDHFKGGCESCLSILVDNRLRREEEPDYIPWERSKPARIPRWMVRRI